MVRILGYFATRPYTLPTPQSRTDGRGSIANKAGYTATPVTCGWAGAVIGKVTRAFGQEQLAQKAQPTDGQSGV